MFEDQDFKNQYVVGLNGFTYAELERAFSDCFTSNNKNESHVTIEGIEKYKLTKVEALHILGYTAQSSRWINQKLREKRRKIDNNCEIFVKNLDLALSKIPPSNNMNLFHMTDYVWNGMKEGAVITIPNYLSTSIEDYENSSVVLRISTAIENSQARDISCISNNKDELEHLFLRETSFKVVKIEKIKKVTYVDMNEACEEGGFQCQK